MSVLVSSEGYVIAVFQYNSVAESFVKKHKLTDVTLLDVELFYSNTELGDKLPSHKEIFYVTENGDIEYQ